MNDTIDKIIRFELCPLQDNNQGNDYYDPLFRQLGVVEENFVASYKIKFEAPEFSSKVKFYRRLIDNTITKCLNEKLSDESDKNIVLYRRKKLHDKVKSYLTGIKDIIVNNNLDLNIIFTVRDYSEALHLNECTYIFHYLILSLIRCYMEFQQHFIKLIEPDKQRSIADFFVQVLQWKVPDNIGIEEIKKVEVQPEYKVIDIKPATKTEQTLSFTYSKLGTNPDNISYLMDSLRKNGFIASDTNAIDFKRVFSGKKVENPIRWTTHFGGLLDLFRQLNKHKLIKYDGNNMYKIVCACFVNAEGKVFSEKMFKEGKTAKSISNSISKAVDLMK